MNNPPRDNTAPTSSLLALFASDYDSGIVLCCGESLSQYCKQIASAMPMTTKMVINVTSERGQENCRHLPSQDIRIAVHKQDHLSFLQDISRYLFNLVLIEDNPSLNEMISGLLDKLMPGAVMVIIGSNLQSVTAALPATGWHTVDTGWPDRAVLIRAQSKNAQPKTRKGGRRARILAR